MTAVVCLGGSHERLASRLAVLREIEEGETIKTRVIHSDNYLIVHHISTRVGEYWDLAYGDSLSDNEFEELVDLEEKVFKRYGVRAKDIAVLREENPWPHPMFPASEAHTYVRLCPKVVL